MSTNKLENLLNLNAGGDLGGVIKRARAMGELTEALSGVLPESDRSAIVAANIRNDDELVVICASSAWASRLRYETDALIEAARNSGAAVRTCRVRVSQK